MLNNVTLLTGSIPLFQLGNLWGISDTPDMKAILHENGRGKMGQKKCVFCSGTHTVNFVKQSYRKRGMIARKHHNFEEKDIENS